MQWPQTVLLLSLTGGAVLADIRYTRIPNGLIVAGLLCGMIYQVVCMGMLGLLFYLSGIILPVLLLWMLYYFRMIGAGDVKLLSMIGGFLGPRECFSFMICTFLTGGVISVICILRRKNLYLRLAYFKAYFSDFLTTKQWVPYLKLEEKDSYFYFSIPVFISTVFYLSGIF